MKIKQLITTIWVCLSLILVNGCDQNVSHKTEQKPEPVTPVDVSKLPPIPENELKVIEEYVRVTDEGYRKQDELDTDRKRRYLFDKENRMTIRVEKHLKFSTEEEFKSYVQKEYSPQYKQKAIESFCEGQQSRIQGKIRLKNHISSKLVEQDKDGNEFYSWTISPSEHCQGELKKLGIHY